MKPVDTKLFVAHYRESDGKLQSVREHLEETSVMASGFAGKIGLGSMGALAGMLHDLGKYSAAFQEYIRLACANDESCREAKPKRGEIDHSSTGAKLIWESMQSQSPLFHIARQTIALCIASHHGGLIDCLSPEGEDAFSKRMAKTIERTSCKEEEEYVRGHVAKLLASSPIEEELHHRLEEMRKGEQSLEIGAFMLGFLTRFLFSALIDADRLNTADFEDETMALDRYNGSYPDWAILIEKLETHLAGLKRRHKVDKIRCKVSSACLDFANRARGLYQLTVPTGGGKTLASLRFALYHAERHGMDRIIYVAPYISIIDQNAAVARSILEKNNDSGKPIVLEHHSNLTPEKDTDQNKLLSENWDAPVVFTTAVQFLETLFGSGTRGVRRMHQLANSVIILDEVQTIPIRTIHLFNNAINFLVGQCGSTVVLCTATQPLLDKVDIKKGAAMLSTDPEMMPDVEGLFRGLRRVEVVDSRKVGGWTEDEIANAAMEEMKDTGSVLVVVNTKAHAREVYRRCRERTKHVFHLSTNMCPMHRMHHLNKIKRRLDPDKPKPVICVSTQLIEAGVDVDFGSVVRSLAGLDSIAQAAGRCNRNNLRPAGRVLIVNPLGENLDKLPDIRRAQEVCERVLREFQTNPAAFGNDLLSPKAMERYYHYYFFERAHEMAYPVSANKIGRNDTLLSLLSSNDQAVMSYKRVHKAAPPFCLRQSFKSAAEAFEAIDSPTQGVVVPYGCGKQIINDMLSSTGLYRKGELLRKAQRYSVNMFPNDMEKLSKSGAIREVWEGSGVQYLREQYYSDEFGVSVEPVGLMENYTV